MRDTRLNLARLLALAALILPTSSYAATEAAPVPVTVTAKGCEPQALTVPAGKVTFVITNRSSRALEWEILKGVMIVDERENIAPGFKQRLVTTLAPGDYEVTCGLLSNPRGKLTVVNADGGTQAAAARPGLSELIGLSAEYRVWTLHAQADLATPAAAFSDALRALSPSPNQLIEGVAESARRLATAEPADAAALLAAITAPASHLLPLVKRADPGLGTALETQLAALSAAVPAGGPLAPPALALAGELARLPGVLGLI